MSFPDIFITKRLTTQILGRPIRASCLEYPNNHVDYLDRVKRIWYLSPMQAAKVQASLRIRAVSPEP